MSAQEAMIADAVAAELNAGGQSWTAALVNPAVRTWSPWYAADAGALDTLRVSVVATRIAQQEDADRAGTRLYGYEVWIDFQQRVAIDTTTGLPTTAAVDAVALTADQIHQGFNALNDDAHTLATLPGWHVVRAEREMLFDENVLYSEHVFVTAIKLTVQGFR